MIVKAYTQPIRKQVKSCRMDTKTERDCSKSKIQTQKYTILKVMPRVLMEEEEVQLDVRT